MSTATRATGRVLALGLPCFARPATVLSYQMIAGVRARPPRAAPPRGRAPGRPRLQADGAARPVGKRRIAVQCLQRLAGHQRARLEIREDGPELR